VRTYNVGNASCVVVRLVVVVDLHSDPVLLSVIGVADQVVVLVLITSFTYLIIVVISRGSMAAPQMVLDDRPLCWYSSSDALPTDV